MISRQFSLAWSSSNCWRNWVISKKNEANPRSLYATIQRQLQGFLSLPGYWRLWGPDFPYGLTLERQSWAGLYKTKKGGIRTTCSRATQLFPTTHPRDCSPPGSSVRGIHPARILEGAAISSSRGSSQPRDQTRFSFVSCIGRQILYCCTTREAHCSP